MIHAYTINGLPLKTGDILCTTDGTPHSWFGRVWQLIGYLVPGEVDHIIVYVGPGPRFVEAGARGVIEFEMPGHHWHAAHVANLRLLVDTLLGVAYPLEGLDINLEQETAIREKVAAYCLDHVGRPYNANFLKVVTNEAFYCSQLAYVAYLEAGLDIGIAPVHLLDNRDNDAKRTPLLVLPTALLNNCHHRMVTQRHWLPQARKAKAYSKASSA